jgi:PAP2 superfamily
MFDLLAPFRATLRVLDRFEWMVDRSERSQSSGAMRIRRSLALVLLVSGIILAAFNIARGGTPGPGHVMMLMLAVALYTNSSGRFIRDWTPVLTIVIVYGLAFRLAETLKLPITYTPQIQADKLIGFGTLPTVFLQQHLHLSLGIEAFCVLMYTSHFFFPLILGFYLWHVRRGEGFGELMYTDVLLSLLAGVTYVLLPSAPPWLAADHGLAPGVHSLLTTSLDAVGLGDIAAFKGDAKAYDVAAAFPSIHAAFPVVGVLVIRKYRLPAWLLYIETVRMVGVWFTIVYTGEHYVVDILAGIAYALVTWWIVQRLRDRRRPPAPGGGDSDTVELIRVSMRDQQPASPLASG